MRLIVLSALSGFLFSCGSPAIKKDPAPVFTSNIPDSVSAMSYAEIKNDIAIKRKQFALRYSSLHDSSLKELSAYWVKEIGNELYNKWKNTPWDFNGTTNEPQQGTIACGYFVNSILQAMDMKINRTKLSICPSSQMMKALTPQQKMRNLSSMDYNDFNDALKAFPAGVYIIGLDFHTGFIINDGTQVWFLHSNYIGRKGVIKETVLSSAALKISKTRWLISLTDDKYFLLRWLKG